MCVCDLLVPRWQKKPTGFKKSSPRFLIKFPAKNQFVTLVIVQYCMVNKLDKVDEMDTVLEKYQLPKLTQGEIGNLNRTIPSEEIESVIKKLPLSGPSPDGFTTEFHQTFKEDLIQMLQGILLHKLF